jgi:hypothetical protein
LLHQTLGGFSQHVPLILAQVGFLILGLDSDQENRDIDAAEEMYDTISSRFALSLSRKTEFSASTSTSDGVADHRIGRNEIDDLHDFTGGEPANL